MDKTLLLEIIPVAAPDFVGWTPRGDDAKVL